jgi:hypothetical protein
MIAIIAPIKAAKPPSKPQRYLAELALLPSLIKRVGSERGDSAATLPELLPSSCFCNESASRIPLLRRRNGPLSECLRARVRSEFVNFTVGVAPGSPRQRGATVSLPIAVRPVVSGS